MLPEEDFSMSRDITDKDRSKFHWWEPILYLALLAIMVWLEATFLCSNKFFQ
jgi:hypothetical protein